jgi:gamma-glutamylcyclotransferase (GGCT)/AIG2-like uncharacterized protein YtfP
LPESNGGNICAEKLILQAHIRIDTSMQLPLFIYGSLIDPVHRAEIIGRPIEAMAATLNGYERGKRRYWYIRARPGATVEGAILTGLTEEEFATLDEYEEVPTLYTRKRITATLGDGTERECWVYLPTGWAEE